MRLPAPLLRKKNNVHKNQFGHVLLIAGSPRMLGAAALSGLAAMRSGAGLVTIGVPKSLNLTLQKKISPVIMTLPLAENSDYTLSSKAWTIIKQESKNYQAAAIGPGLGQQSGTQRLIQKIISEIPIPLVIDADGLNALAAHLQLLKKTAALRILTPHPGEMARLTKLSKSKIELNRKSITEDFADRFPVTLLLKGHRTLISQKGKRTYINRTGNAGMATAGSGDVLTGMLTAFLAQGIDCYEAAKLAAFYHGRAGDMAAQKLGKTSLIATDIIDFIPQALNSGTS